MSQNNRNIPITVYFEQNLRLVKNKKGNYMKSLKDLIVSVTKITHSDGSYVNEIEIHFCETCIKRQTMNCPNSELCYSTENKPHWKPYWE